jgi:hypothetical protein
MADFPDYVGFTQLSTAIPAPPANDSNRNCYCFETRGWPENGYTEAADIAWLPLRAGLF